MPSIRGQVDSRAARNLIHLSSIIGIDFVAYPDGPALFHVKLGPKLGQATPLYLVNLTISALMVSKYSAVSSDSLF
jgi:hypothetical protein